MVFKMVQNRTVQTSKAEDYLSTRLLHAFEQENLFIDLLVRWKSEDAGSDHAVDKMD